MDAEIIAAMLDPDTTRLRAVGGVFDPTQSLLVVLLDDGSLAELPMRRMGEAGGWWPQVVGHA